MEINANIDFNILSLSLSPTEVCSGRNHASDGTGAKVRYVPKPFLLEVLHNRFEAVGIPTKTSSRYFTSPEGFSSSGDVWYDSGEVVLTREA